MAQHTRGFIRRHLSQESRFVTVCLGYFLSRREPEDALCDLRSKIPATECDHRRRKQRVLSTFLFEVWLVVERAEVTGKMTFKEQIETQ